MSGCISWIFISNLYVVGGGGVTHTSPPPPRGLLQLQVGSKNPTGYSPTFGSVMLQNITIPSTGHHIFKSAEAACFFYSGFCHFLQWKLSYFEVLIKFKKNGNTICCPKLIKKNIELKGVKLFCWILKSNAPAKGQI